MDKAALRGNPSFVWRAGQERRLGMVRSHVPLDGASILAVGCGVGMYTSAFQRHTSDTFGIEIEMACTPLRLPGLSHFVVLEVQRP